MEAVFKRHSLFCNLLYNIKCYRSIGDAVRYRKPCMMRHRRECRVCTKENTSELRSSEPYDSKLRIIYDYINRLFICCHISPHIRAKAHHAGLWISHRTSGTPLCQNTNSP